MRKKGFLIFTFIMVILLLQTVVYAEVRFKDIENHWAKKEILEMVDKKIILGYPDGTFKPDKEVTKLDILIMASRILGVDKDENKEDVTIAENSYRDVLSSYNIYGKKEISFLLKKKVLQVDELDTYFKGENARAYAKRYEAAIIFTKVLGKEKEVKDKTFVVLPFLDSHEIPINAKPYVEFMINEGIMKGVDKTKFQPHTYLTRAQAAVMLLRVNNKLEERSVVQEPNPEKSVTGVIVYLNPSTKSLIVKDSSKTYNYTLTDSTPIKIDNSNSEFGRLEIGFRVTVKTKGSEIIEVIASSRPISKVVEGFINSIAKTPSVKISIKRDYETDAVVEEYQVDEYLHIVRNNSLAGVDDLKVEDDVTVYVLENNKIGKIVAESKEKTISGVVEDLIIDDKVYLVVKTDNKSNKYEVMSDVVVHRNGLVTGLKDVKPGDEVAMTLWHNRVKVITAVSKKSSIQGVIEEIYISRNPKITVKSGNDTITYNVDKDATIKVDNAVCEIYDLRLGYKAVFDLDNNIIVGINAQKKVEPLEVRGIIKLVNLNLGLITLVEENQSSTVQIYVSPAITRVNDAVKSTTLSLNDLKPGKKIIAYGKNDNGVFVTSVIVVMSEE